MRTLGRFFEILAIIGFIILLLVSSAIWGEVLGTLGIPLAILLFPIGILSFPLVGWLVLDDTGLLWFYVMIGVVLGLGGLGSRLRGGG